MQQALWWCETISLHVHWYVAVCCKCKRACAFLHVPLEAGVVPVYCGQYIRGNVQGRLATRACDFEKEEWQKTSGNLQLQLKTLELYHSNFNNSALWKMQQRTNPFFSF